MINLVPRTLLVVQVIFGKPLRGVSVFHVGQVEWHVGKQIGQGNAAKVVDRLLDDNWLRLAPKPERFMAAPTGRLPVYFYRRTQDGWKRYRQLSQSLAEFGIQLT